MKPAAFEYVAAHTLEDAIAALAAGGGGAKIIAGGQSLVPMLNFRLLRPAIRVDIKRIPGFAYIEEDQSAIRIGALTTHRQLEISPVIARLLPVLSHAMTHVAHLAIRNRGTIGGSLSHADPAAELPMLTLLLDGEFAIASRAGRRTVRARNFFLDALTVDLADDDVITEIVLPKLPADTGWGFEEVARRAGDFALAAVAVTITPSRGTIAQARISVTGMGSTPVRAAAAEALLAGHVLDQTLRDDVIAAVRDSVNPNSDLHASAAYRGHWAGVRAGRAVSAAWARAQSPKP